MKKEIDMITLDLLNVYEEWEILKREVHNKPVGESPYSQETVRLRELLLMAEVLLEKYEIEKSIDQKAVIELSYRKTITSYFELSKN